MYQWVCIRYPSHCQHQVLNLSRSKSPCYHVTSKICPWVMNFSGTSIRRGKPLLIIHIKIHTHSSHTNISTPYINMQCHKVDFVVDGSRGSWRLRAALYSNPSCMNIWLPAFALHGWCNIHMHCTVATCSRHNCMNTCKYILAIDTSI